MKIIIPGRPRPWSRSWKPGGAAKTATSVEQLKTLTQYLFAAKAQSRSPINPKRPWNPSIPVTVRAGFFFGDRKDGRTEIEVQQLLEVDTWQHVDIDNLCKLVLEALQHSGIVEDDSQVIKLEAFKRIEISKR